MEKHIWTNEDGDHYFCEQHLPLDTMRELCVAFEVKNGDGDAEFIEAIRSTESVQHLWLLECSENGEVLHEVSEGTKDALPFTVLYR